MVATEVRHVATTSNGKNRVQVLIVADETPNPLPTTGEGIKGLSANDVFAPLSVIYVVANVTPKIYVANESGVFVAQLEQ